MGDEHGLGALERVGRAEHAGVDDDARAVLLEPGAGVPEQGDVHGAHPATATLRSPAERQLTTRTRSPPSSCCTAPIASRVTVPPPGVVMATSIFMAPTVATVCPACTLWPSCTTGVTAPANGAAMWPGT